MTFFSRGHLDSHICLQVCRACGMVKVILAQKTTPLKFRCIGERLGWASRWLQWRTRGQRRNCRRNHVNDLDLLTLKGVLFTEERRLNTTT